MSTETMDVSTRQAIDATLKALDPSAAQEALTQKVQVSLLKKSLDSQREQAATLLRMMEGKGNVIDIKV